MKRKLFGVWLAALTVLCAAMAQEKSAKKPQFDPKTVVKEPKVAVVVGVKDYDGPSAGFDPLEYSTRDAEELADALRKQGYRVFGDCPKPSTRDDCALTDSMARNNLVKKNLELAVDTVLDGHGTLIFAFSGHGVQQSPHDPQYLALFGASMTDLRAATITVEEVEKILERTSARRMLFIDACKTAPAGSGDGNAKLAHGTQGFYESLSEASGVRIMYSTKNPYPSWEDPNLGGGHGRFSYYLTEGLQGKALDAETGLLTFDSLFQYVHEQMVQENQRHKDKLQFVTQDGPHDLDFYIAGEGKNAPAVSTAEAGPKRRNRRVLLMGNNMYPQNSLASAVADARALREQFVSKLGMNEAAITVLTDGTKKQMDQALAKYAASVGPNEDAIVYFSGMGAMAGDEPYITPSDYRLSDAVAPGAAIHRGITIRVDNGTAADYENWVGIPVRKILELLSVKPGIRKVLIFDMCLTAVKAGIPGWALPPSDGTTAMLFAAWPGHEAQETKDHGYFTASMLRLLDENPEITWNEFTGKVWTMTREATRGRQVPFVNGYLRDDFVFEEK